MDEVVHDVLAETGEEFSRPVAGAPERAVQVQIGLGDPRLRALLRDECGAIYLRVAAERECART